MSVMKEKMHTGELYLPGDDEIMEWQTQCLERLYEFNMTRPTEFEKRQTMMKEMFAEIGENCYIEPPFHSNFGGGHVHFGKNIYCNFGCTFVDDTHIYVGDYTMFGPNVTIATAGHPILPELREQAYQYNAPVHIGKNCWIGAGAIVLPGITIGDNVVVGAGSVVTKDLPSNVVAVGNPCKVLREVNERDKEYYFKGRKLGGEFKSGKDTQTTKPAVACESQTASHFASREAAGHIPAGIFANALSAGALPVLAQVVPESLLNLRLPKLSLCFVFFKFDKPNGKLSFLFWQGTQNVDQSLKIREKGLTRVGRCGMIQKTYLKSSQKMKRKEVPI